MRDWKNRDSLGLPKDESEEVFHELGCHINKIINDDLALTDLALMPRHAGLPQACSNMLCVLCAEGARRRRRSDLSDVIMAECTNPAYKQLYDRWLKRFCARNVKSKPGCSEVAATA